MPALKYQDVLERVKERPVFTVDDLTDCGVPRDYAKTLLYRLNKRGEIARVERGKYTILENPLIVAPHLTRPSYLSLWTALRFHGISQQSPFGVEVITSRSRYNRELEFRDTKIHFHRVKPGMMFGYSYEVYENNRIPVALPEKAIIDGLYLNIIPLGELREVLPELDREKLRHFSSRVDQTMEERVEEVLA